MLALMLPIRLLSFEAKDIVRLAQIEKCARSEADY
jgi:hypothetical protein